MGGSLTKIVTFGTIHFIRYSRHDRYLGCPLLGDITVFPLNFLKAEIEFRMSLQTKTCSKSTTKKALELLQLMLFGLRDN